MEDSAVCLAEIRRALACADSQALARQAHRLRGASGNLGVTNVQGICAELEVQAEAQPEALAELIPLADSLAEQLLAVQSVLQDMRADTTAA